MTPHEQARVVVAGVTYDGWLSVDIDSDCMTPADAFVVRGRLPTGAARRDFVERAREGVHCEVYIGEDRQMAGVLDRIEYNLDDRENTVQLIGRDRAAYLVDNEAEAIRAERYTLPTLAEKLLRPEWGIAGIVLDNAANRKLQLGKRDVKGKAGTSRGRRSGPLFAETPRAATTIDPGQRISAILDERTRQLGVTWWMTARGELFLGSPDYDQDPAGQLLILEGARRAYSNCTATVTRAIDERYSEITLVGQGSAASSLFGAQATSAKGARFRARATDPDLVNRGIRRRMIMTDADTLNSRQARDRVECEMGRRRLNGFVVRARVAGWRQDGRLWTIDTLVSAQFDPIGWRGLLWLGQRRFLDDGQRQTTELTLYLPRVWLA